MNSREILKEIMSTKEVSNATMADRLKISQATLWDRLNNTKVKKDMAVSTLDDMLHALDYKIVLVPRNTRVPDGGYEVD